MTPILPDSVMKKEPLSILHVLWCSLEELVATNSPDRKIVSFPFLQPIFPHHRAFASQLLADPFIIHVYL